MIIAILGIDYKSTPINLREIAFLKRAQIENFWQEHSFLGKALFTCNRIELYGFFKNIESPRVAFRLLKEEFPEMFDQAYIKTGEKKVFEYILSLGVGLESQVIGEMQILNQLKSWHKNLDSSCKLKQIFSESLSLSQKVRSLVGLNDPEANLANIVAREVSSSVSSSEKVKIVIVGTGKIAELFADKLYKNFEITFVSRKKHSRSRQLARKCHGEALLLDRLEELITKADVLIGATSSSHYVVKKELFNSISHKRKKPLYIYDLALPRDVDPEVATHEFVILKNTEDIDELLEKHNVKLKANILRAQLLIEESVSILLDKESNDFDKVRDKTQHFSS